MLCDADKLFNTKENERATAYTYIIIDETTNKTLFVDTNRQGCQNGKGQGGTVSEKGTLVVNYINCRQNHAVAQLDC